jgi:four helix bundle protein
MNIDASSIKGINQQSYQNYLAYKDLIVWQKSIEFATQIIDLAENLSSTRKHYRLIEQIEAAATSVPMNIAEGKGRFSKKEYGHYLMIARGSLYESMTLLEIFKIKKWIPEENFIFLENQSVEISKILSTIHHNLRIGD